MKHIKSIGLTAKHLVVSKCSDIDLSEVVTQDENAEITVVTDKGTFKKSIATILDELF